MTQNYGYSRSMLILQQSTSLDFPGLRPILIYSPKLQNGPSDDLLENALPQIVNIRFDDPDRKELFSDSEMKQLKKLLRNGINEIDVFSDEKNTKNVQLLRRFDIVNVFATARVVLTMYQRALERIIEHSMDEQFDFRKAWGTKLAINIYAVDVDSPEVDEDPLSYHDHNHQVAYYQFNKKSGVNIIDLGRIKKANGQYAYSCRNFDAIAHEVGHAVYTALRAEHWNKHSTNVETKAIEEWFSDLTCIFALLSQLDVCQAIIASTKGDLEMDSFLTQIAEGLGLTGGPLRTIRDHRNYKELIEDKQLQSPHEYAKVFADSILEFIIQLYNSHVDPCRYDPAETLFRVGKYVISLVTAAVYETRRTRLLSFEDLAEKILDKIINPSTKKVMGSEMEHVFWHNLYIDILHDRGIIIHHRFKLTIENFLDKH